MDIIVWLKFLALANICAFLWYVRCVFRKNVNMGAFAEALRFRGGSKLLRGWWATFLICFSYRFGACATSSPEAVAYGILPTILVALIVIELAERESKKEEEEEQAARERIRTRYSAGRGPGRPRKSAAPRE